MERSLRQGPNPKNDWILLTLQLRERLHVYVYNMDMNIYLFSSFDFVIYLKGGDKDHSNYTTKTRKFEKGCSTLYVLVINV